MSASASDLVRKSYSFLQKSLASGINNTDTTITLNNATSIPTDTAVDFIIDRIDTNGSRTTGNVKELCKGVVSGSTIINVTRGLHGTTAQSHSSGAVVEFVASGAAWNDFASAFMAQHSQLDGSHGAVTATSLSVSGTSSFTGAVTLPTGTVTSPKLATELQKGWESSYGGTTVPAPNTVTCNGNRSYDLVFNGVDLTSSLSAGMRLRTTRTVAAPTQCTSLNGTTQYYSKSSPAGMTFTDDFTVSAWVKLSSYANGIIVSRFNGTSGWYLWVDSSGLVKLSGFNGGAANFKTIASYQSVPLNKWVHIGAQLDMSAGTATSTTCYVMLDGVDVPANVITGGTNPTALIQAGNLEVGAYNAGAAGTFFPGKIAQVAIYSAKVTQANIRATISQGLTGSETSLISAYSFNNSINDLNANANNLTANGSAVATNADSPFGGQADGTISSTLDYAIVTKTAFSTNTTVTVQVPEGCTIPTTGGVSAVSYSTQKAPYLFPAAIGKWKLISLFRSQVATTSNANFGSFNGGGCKLTVPIGDWVVGYDMGLFNASTTGVVFNLSPTDITGTAKGAEDLRYSSQIVAAAASTAISPTNRRVPEQVTSQSGYVMYSQGATVSGGIDADNTNSEIFAELALL